MKAIINVNGKERTESLCIVDTLNNEVTLIEIDKQEIKLNMDEVYVEINIFGKTDL